MKRKVSKNSQNIKRFSPSVNEGLNEKEVSYMIEHGQVNVSTSPTNKSYLKIILDNVFTPFNILMVVIAVVLLAIVGSRVITNLTFIAIILFNVLIGTIQECRAKHTIEKLKLLTDSKVTVRRSGNEIQVHPTELVLDDVVVLSSGDQIPADCIILEDDVLEINESLLTGESIPIKKTKGDMVYAGSFIVSGSLAVQAIKVGNDTYLKSIENKAKETKQPKSRLMVSINKIIHLLTSIAIPLSVIVFVNELLQIINHNTDNLSFFPSYWGEDSLLTNAVFYGGMTIAYMIPCGMALLASIAMATGVYKLAQSQTLVQDLYSVESLSRVDTLCLDKTGTLTDGTMMVEEIFSLDDNYQEEELSNIFSSYQAAFKTANQTATAIINKFGKEAKYKAVDTIQFSSARKYSAVNLESLGWFALGAPEYLTEDKELLDKVNEFTKCGLRVVLLVKFEGSVENEEVLPKKRNNIAMLTIRDNIRPEVKDTMLWFSENDVDIKVISGDNIGTVGYIAKQSGIKNYDKAVDLSKLTEEDDLEEIVFDNAIFGRVSPDQKAQIISILKAHGRVTGVTGDGLNDLLAFKQADCSIALANGAAATKNVANLVLLDSNFANMKEAVFQGRRVVNNIQRSSSLFIMKDFLWMFITILPILLGVPHIIQPVVMSLVNIFITGFASFFVALEPDKSIAKGNFLRNVIEKALSAGFFMFNPVIFVMLYFIVSSLIRTGNYDLSLMKTVFENGEIVSLGWIPVISLSVTVCGIIIFLENCKPFTTYRKILFGITIFIILNVAYLMPEFFIVNGTDLLTEIGGFQNLFKYIFGHMGVNATLYLYRTWTLEQVLVFVGFNLICYPAYILNKKFAKISFDRIFKSQEIEDE